MNPDSSEVSEEEEENSEEVVEESGLLGPADPNEGNRQVIPPVAGTSSGTNGSTSRTTLAPRLVEEVPSSSSEDDNPPDRNLSISNTPLHTLAERTRLQLAGLMPATFGNGQQPPSKKARLDAEAAAAAAKKALEDISRQNRNVVL